MGLQFEHHICQINLTFLFTVFTSEVQEERKIHKAQIMSEEEEAGKLLVSNFVLTLNITIFWHFKAIFRTFWAFYIGKCI